MNQKSILLILPYFGKWPIWFDAHLKSIAYNDSINWLIVTDCELPKDYPSNIRFVSKSLTDLNLEVNKVVNANVPLIPRKFCDLKPAYGDIFKEYTTGYDFWGFCDMDIIWGDIRKFITDDILEYYDIISSRKEAISGHFNLFKNTPALRVLYKQVPLYQVFFENPKGMFFDEGKLTDFIKHQIEKDKMEYQIFWNTILLNQERGRDSWQGYYLDKWYWSRGVLIQLKNGKKVDEVMYLHFLSWKRKMKYCKVKFKDENNSFYISYEGIKSDKNPKSKIFFNSLKNLIYGFWFREKLKAKIKKYKKKVNRKFKNIR